MAKGSSILVTGGAGYLGSILVPELLAAGHRVTVLDNFMYLQNSLSANCANPNFDVVNGDTRSVDTLKPLVAKADYVFPLAALVGAPLCKKDPIAATTTNLIGTSPRCTTPPRSRPPCGCGSRTSAQTPHGSASTASRTRCSALRGATYRRTRGSSDDS